MTPTSLPIISLVGPTGSGKSDLALLLGKELLSRKKAIKVILLNADSRQVYRGLSVISGADVSSDFMAVGDGNESSPPYTFFRHDTLPIELYGVSIVSPLHDWSAASFQELATYLIQNLNENELLIIVGGTMLYQSIIDHPELETIAAPNPTIRTKATGMSSSELQEWLRELDADRLHAMNESDASNPRRLIRAIEQASTSTVKQQQSSHEPNAELANAGLWKISNRRWFGLDLESKVLEAKIVERVKQRMSVGAVAEVVELRQIIELHQKKPSDAPAWSACGIKFLLAFESGEITSDECAALWAAQELRYSKRQLTWWKKQQGIEWLPAASPKERKSAMNHIITELYT